MKPVSIMTQAQVRAACLGALSAGAQRVVVEATLPSGTTLRVTADAETAKLVKYRCGGRRSDKAESPPASTRQAAI
jgi:hypothetical protein